MPENRTAGAVAAAEGTDASFRREARRSDVSVSTPTPAGDRLVSLDAYRGFIMLTLMAGSIFKSLKDDPQWNWLYRQNEHMAWEGCTYWDLIQPSFMFMVGVAMPFAFARRTALDESWGRQFRHVLLRALNLILLGVLLDHIGATKIQIGFIRVLQQIAFGYVAAFFVLGRSFRVQGLVALAILVGYQLLWMYNPWNGPEGPWAHGDEKIGTLDRNIGSAFDLWLLGRNYSGHYVGMNAIPSTATIIFGVMAGQLIERRLPPLRTLGLLILFGAIGVAAGMAVSPWFPLIKRIWTPSFAVFSAGCTTLILAAFYWSADVTGRKRWALPLVVVGMNSIAAYVFGNAFRGWFGSATNVWIKWLEEPLGSKTWYPVFQQALFMCAGWALMYWFYRRRIFFKV